MTSPFRLSTEARMWALCLADAEGGFDRRSVQVPEEKEREDRRGQGIAQVAGPEEREDRLEDLEDRQKVAEHPAPRLQAPGCETPGPEGQPGENDQPAPDP